MTRIIVPLDLKDHTAEPDSPPRTRERGDHPGPLMRPPRWSPLFLLAAQSAASSLAKRVRPETGFRTQTARVSVDKQGSLT